MDPNVGVGCFGHNVEYISSLFMAFTNFILGEFE
jgi:hypothetical protein